MDERERHLVEDLVTKARAGDPEAFSCLFELYSPDLSRFVRCLVGNPHDAQDVVQDAWLQAWRCLGTVYSRLHRAKQRLRCGVEMKA